MKCYTLRAASAAFLLAAGTVPALAADPPRPIAGAAVNNTFRAKQVLGTKILIQNNTAVGTVEDLVFDDAGNLEYMIVSTNDSKLITVPWEAAKFDLEKKTAVLGITADAYKAIPTYTVTTYPQFYAPTYRTEIFRTYGLTPRELRRLERRLP
ncbi:PRC-barrel domain-containing protein [Frigoriglobus tundricola]|uniref:PRC-barrel domain-containing protein n=1 Tax=Frigoriglobus tundricola TaxID=2774151 RepID=A0A6M5YI30_9BACT|nr:PRC-barrel domain-containing protein [Frigoriglobus tundricola]QJW93194.1 hypothetical protein FTUN_0699 [Frigoriglobus tundricola]